MHMNAITMFPYIHYTHREKTQYTLGISTHTIAQTQLTLAQISLY